MTDLRQAEPVAYFDFQDLTFSWAKHMQIGPVPVSIKVEPMKLYLEAPKQQAEPASGCACRWDYKDDRVATCERHQGWLDVIAEWADRARDAEKKLKAAQPERQWVGLTDEEMSDTVADMDVDFGDLLWKVVCLTKIIEAKLKERNGY